MTKKTNMALCLPLHDVHRESHQYQISATEAERQTLCERFNLVSIESLEAVVTVETADVKGGVLVSGQLRAAFHQKCIATLDPVEESLDVPFSLLLVDVETANNMDDDEVYLDPDAPDYDALEGDQVEVGEIVAQTLAVSMNPYPRRPDGKIDTGGKSYVTLDEPEIQKKNPFAVLAKLKDES